MANGLTNAKGASGIDIIKPVFSEESTLECLSFTADKDYDSLLLIYLRGNNFNNTYLLSHSPGRDTTICEVKGFGFIGIYIENNVVSGRSIPPPAFNGGSYNATCYTCMIEVSDIITNETSISSYTFNTDYDKILVVRYNREENNYRDDTSPNYFELEGDMGVRAKGKNTFDDITSDTILSGFVYSKGVSDGRPIAYSETTGLAVACDVLYNVKSGDTLTFKGSCSMALFKLP